MWCETKMPLTPKTPSCLLTSPRKPTTLTPVLYVHLQPQHKVHPGAKLTPVSRCYVLVHTCCIPGSSKGGGDSSSDNGWAKSERSRLSKALHSLRVRQKALQGARESEPMMSPSPPTHDGLDATVAVGGGRKRPRSGEHRPAEGRPAENGHGGWGSRGRTPSPPRLGALPATRFEPVDER